MQSIVKDFLGYRQGQDHLWVNLREDFAPT